MEVILKKALKRLGHRDDIVTVKPGYGRNYLIPQGIAVVASDANRKVALENVRQAAHKRAHLRAAAEATAVKISGLELILKVKVGTTGKIFGAVTALQLANLLKEHGVQIDRKNIGFVDPIREIGIHEATAVLYKDLIHTFHFKVVAAG
ncbi:MAG: 50S ribosomal protein L9 [Bacteroidota bacterium]